MKISQLAEQWKTTGDEILKTLKSLRLKAKDTDQDLNAAVISVLKSAMIESGKVREEDLPKEPPVKKKAVRKKAAKKATTKKKAAQKEEAEEKPASKKAVKKKAPAKAKEETVAEPESKEEKTTTPAPVKTEKKAVKKEPKVQAEKPKAPSTAGDKEQKPSAGKPQTTTVKRRIIKKKIKSKETPAKPAKPSISSEPLITLKPLARKRRKTTPGGRDDTRRGKGRKKNKGKEIQETSFEEYDSKLDNVDLTEDNWLQDKSLPDMEINVPITVKDLSVKINQKPSSVLTELMKMGVMAHINQGLDGEIVSRLTQRFGLNLVKIKTQEEQVIETHRKEEEDPEALLPRAPVITFMGHVDHGKTSLLDRIRESKVTQDEHGGITQHMGAYSVRTEKGRITLLDTPGHEAFTAMRARGAHITDLVILVVAADEGIMPQTKEAIDHARAAGVPIIVAMNKMDKPNADPDRLKQQLSEIELAPEDWGGKTVVVGVSAITGQGIDELLELVLLEAEMLELKANPEKNATGIIVEAHLSQGRGAVATAIVQSGTLKEGDDFCAGSITGRVKAMFDDHARRIRTAGPSVPVEIIGLSDVPNAGDVFYVVEDDRIAREIVDRRSQELQQEKMTSKEKVTLEDLYAKTGEQEQKEVNFILKADVQGSLEALRDSLEKIPSDKVKIKFIHCAVGEVNASDVLLALASKAIIIAFHVGLNQRAKNELEKEPVEIREYSIIYDAVNDIRDALEGMLEDKHNRIFQARVEVREVFKLSKQGIVAGSFVEQGKVHRKAHVDVIRDDQTVYQGRIASLKRFKDDVKEVSEGMECGIQLENYEKYQPGDIIECYAIEKVTQRL